MLLFNLFFELVVLFVFLLYIGFEFVDLVGVSGDL